MVEQDSPEPPHNKRKPDPADDLGPDPLGLDKYTDVFYYITGFFFIGFGIFKVILASMQYPYGSLLDWSVLRIMGIGFFYTFCGLGILVARPKFEWMAGTLFLILFIELMQVGNY